MTYKTIAKFENKKEYTDAKNYLKKVIRDSEGSYIFGKEKDHCETGNEKIKINLHNQKFKITSECVNQEDENFLERKLKEIGVANK